MKIQNGCTRSGGKFTFNHAKFTKDVDVNKFWKYRFTIESFLPEIGIGGGGNCFTFNADGKFTQAAGGLASGLSIFLSKRENGGGGAGDEEDEKPGSLGKLKSKNLGY